LFTSAQLDIFFLSLSIALARDRSLTHLFLVSTSILQLASFTFAASAYITSLPRRLIIAICSFQPNLSRTFLHPQHLPNNTFTMSASPIKDENPTEDKPSQAKLTFTDKEEKVLKVAWQCLKSGPPEVGVHRMRPSSISF